MSSTSFSCSNLPLDVQLGVLRAQQAEHKRRVLRGRKTVRKAQQRMASRTASVARLMLQRKMAPITQVELTTELEDALLVDTDRRSALVRELCHMHPELFEPFIGGEEDLRMLMRQHKRSVNNARQVDAQIAALEQQIKA